MSKEKLSEEVFEDISERESEGLVSNDSGSDEVEKLALDSKEKDFLSNYGLIEGIIIFMVLVPLIVGFLGLFTMSDNVLTWIAISLVSLVINIVFQTSETGKKLKIIQAKRDKINSLKNKDLLDELLTKNKFKLTKEIGISSSIVENRFLAIDDESHKIAVMTVTSGLNNIAKYSIGDIISLDEIIECELIIDDTTVKKSGLGRAVVGGALLGGTGAIVGAITGKSSNLLNDVRIKLVLSNESAFHEIVIFSDFKKGIEKKDAKYEAVLNSADRIYSTIKAYMISKEKNENVETPERDGLKNISPKSKIIELKSMLDEGLISQEDFDNKKRKLIDEM